MEPVDRLEAARLAAMLRTHFGVVSALIQSYESIKKEWNREPTEQEAERALDVFLAVSYVICLLISTWVSS